MREGEARTQRVRASRVRIARSLALSSWAGGAHDRGRSKGVKVVGVLGYT